MPRLSRIEIRKDMLQSAVVAVVDTVGEVTGIVTNAAKDVAGSVAGLATELFELRETAHRAETDLVIDELDDLIEQPAVDPEQPDQPAPDQPES